MHADHEGDSPHGPVSGRRAFGGLPWAGRPAAPLLDLAEQGPARRPAAAAFSSSGICRKFPALSAYFTIGMKKPKPKPSLKRFPAAGALTQALGDAIEEQCPNVQTGTRERGPGSLAWLAQAAGVAQPTLHRIYYGKKVGKEYVAFNPGIQDLEKLIAFFEIKVARHAAK